MSWGHCVEFLVFLAILLGGFYFVVLPILLLVNWSRISSMREQLEQIQARLRQVETPRPSPTQQAAGSLLSPAPVQPDTAPPDAVQSSAQGGTSVALPPEQAPATLLTELPRIVPTIPEPQTVAALEGLRRTARLAHEQVPADVGGATLPQEAASAQAPPPAPVTDKAPHNDVQRSASPADMPPPSLIAVVFNAARNWLFGGNTVVRVGMLLVFLGLAFLLRYASEHAVIPLEVRYLAVAICSVVGLGIGWRLRQRRPAYALLMQGGAVGVMYLTVFAALRLHDHALLPPQAGFVMLVLIVILSGILAVLQNSLALAVAGALGGFAAPVLVSTGGGSHIALFSYFALLNAGILGIAWFKAWRPLNLVGFISTFMIGLAWGMRSYDPALHYASTQAFLALFFLMFVTIGLLFARRVLLDAEDAPTSRDGTEWTAWFARQGHRAQRYVDGTLLFGAPVLGFGLQYGIIRHIEYGPAFSALAMGFFYMLLAWMLQRTNPARHRLLTEVFLALGVVFATLAIPLGLEGAWTSAAWALEGAGIYWIGLRQQRPVARSFATLVQGAATVDFLMQLSWGTETLMTGPVLGAALLGFSFLCNLICLRRLGPQQRTLLWDAPLEGLWGTLGLWPLYCLALITLSPAYGAAALGVAGMLGIFIGLKWQLRGWLGNALLVQLLGGVIFLTHMNLGHSGLILGNGGWDRLALAAIIGFTSLIGLAAAIRSAQQRNNPALVKRLAWATLFGLGFVMFAVLFVLPLKTAVAVWAGCGFAILWAARRLQIRPAFWFALLLEVLSGLGFMVSVVMFGLWRRSAVPDVTFPGAFAHAGFWTPVVLALAAFAMAWRLFVWERDGKQDAGQGHWLSLGVLLWSAAWWGIAWFMELMRLAIPTQAVAHYLLAAMAVSALVCLPVMKFGRWPALAGLSGCLLPMTMLVAATDFAQGTNLLGTTGWLVYPVALVTGLFILRQSGRLLPQAADVWLHVLTCWTWLACASLETRYLFSAAGDAGSTWRWLGWTLPLVVWLLWQARSKPAGFWPLRAHPRIWQFQATLPVSLVLFAWLAIANVGSDGNAAPLPFLPLINPLDLALLLVLFAGWQWTRSLAAQDEKLCRAQEQALPMKIALLGLGFLTYTCIVLRGAHHFTQTGWNVEALMHSMLVQACLSIFWALLALGLMIVGHRRGQRVTWIAGAILVGIVVAKLFFIELSNHGGLERIASFLGVGILMLVVGYFAPLPPAQPSSGEKPENA